jgi:hypothetical protein
MNYREALIHQMWHIVEVRWNVCANINWLLTKSASELRDVRHCGGIQGPKSVLVKKLYPFEQAYLDTICQQIVLPQEVLLLNLIKKTFVTVFSDGHEKGPTFEGPSLRL